MGEGMLKDGIAAGRLGRASTPPISADLHPPLDEHEAFVEADRCYFCFDAPCQTACPTSIDIPLFIREIADRQSARRRRNHLRAEHPGRHVRPRLPHRAALRGSLRARGGRGQAGQDRPAAALRHRHRDARRTRSSSPRGAATGKRVAVVGAGPAGLACAHRLAMHGHEVTIFDARAEGRRAQRIRHRVLQDAGRLRPGRSRLRHRHRRHHASRTARRSGEHFSLADLTREL